MKNDFGASHSFGKSHGHGELRISRTVYFKKKHFDYAESISEAEGINISEAFDRLMQCGIAYNEQLKYQTKLTEVK